MGSANAEPILPGGRDRERIDQMCTMVTMIMSGARAMAGKGKSGA